MPGKSENDPEFRDIFQKQSTGPRFRVINVVIALGIVALLVLLMLPAVRTAGPAARRTQCVNNLKQIALALYNYEQAYQSLPPAFTVDANGRRLHSWRTLILPYLEGISRDYETIDLSKPWDDPVNAQALEKVPVVFQCPEMRKPGNTTTYLAIVGPNACFPPTGARRLAEITDRHETTLMVIEAGQEKAVPWMAPIDADESLVTALGANTKFHHAGGTNACFVDGHVMFLKANVPAEVRRAMMSIAGKDDAVAEKD